MNELMQKYFVRRENDHRELGDTFYYEGTKLKVNKTTDCERACKSAISECTINAEHLASWT